FDGKVLKIAPGLIVLRATKDPFQQQGDVTFTMTANQQKSDAKIFMLNPAVASASALPTDTAAPSASVSGEPAPTTAGTTAPDDQGGLDSMTWVMIILGGLLVALGIGAI